MERRGNGDREQNPDRGPSEAAPGRSGEDNRSAGGRASIPKRDVASWVNWQSALYLFVLGLICVFLVPLTSFWWIVPVLGMGVPITLAIAPSVLDRPGLTSRKPDDRKVKERELLEALAERGELTPSTAAMRTSLTVDEASKMLEDLARKGHLKIQVEDGAMAYVLRERDLHETPAEVSAPSEAASDGDGAARPLGARKRLDDPLSERELEVLNLLTSGRTNSEVARDLFISVGTVKSHTGNIYRKLDARNRAEALARELELLP